MHWAQPKGSVSEQPARMRILQVDVAGEGIGLINWSKKEIAPNLLSGR